MATLSVRSVGLLSKSKVISTVLMIWVAATLALNVFAILTFRWQYTFFHSVLGILNTPTAGLFILLTGTILMSAFLAGLIVDYRWRFRK